MATIDARTRLHPTRFLHRRHVSKARPAILVFGLAGLLYGCASSGQQLSDQNVSPATVAAYAAVEDGPVRIPAVNVRRIDPLYLRQVVTLPPEIKEAPGTIVVDPANRFLYLVEENGTATRYGIGVGKQGFAWSGEAVIHDKQTWPKWFPPDEMIARQPQFAKYDDGMPGGIRNPLGARALYLWQGNKDTLYRLHGTNEPSSIGTAASSGCIRLFNQDAIDLYNRVPIGTKVVVLTSPEIMQQAPLGTEPLPGEPVASPAGERTVPVAPVGYADPAGAG